MRASVVVNSVVYGKGRLEFTTFDAPVETVEVLRLAFVPTQITADGRTLERRADLSRNGYTIKALPNGDAIVSLRHDGANRIVVTGDDPQQVLEHDQLTYEGAWQNVTNRLSPALGAPQPTGAPVPPDSAAEFLRVTEIAGASVTARFTGNQVRLIGRADPLGGCLLYTSPSPRDGLLSRMPSSA